MSARLRTWFRSSAIASSEAELADGDLVRRFVDMRDEGCFVELVRRHGPMVLATCRRVLHPDLHSADDAFQATFLVLATKASAVSPPERVGAWLHGVAIRVAKKAKAWVCKLIPSTPCDLDQMPTVPVEVDLDAVEFRTKLDDVLAGLPSKYRIAVVLCDLEQRSRAEVASILGWSEGTLSGRLARARKLLADRLARRGVVLSVAVGGGLLLPTSAAPATVPGQLAASTIRIAAIVAVGATSNAIPASVAALAQGIPMHTTSFKLSVAFALVALILCGFGLYAFAVAPPNSPPLASVPLAPPPLPTVISAPPEAPVISGKNWDLKHTFIQKNEIETLDFGPGFVATGDRKGVLKLWDVKSGKEKETILDGTGKVKEVNRVQFSPDGTVLYLVINGYDGFARCSVEKMNRVFPIEPKAGGKVRGVTRDGAYWIFAFEYTFSLASDTPKQNQLPTKTDFTFIHEEKTIAPVGESADAFFTLAGLGNIHKVRRWKKGSDKHVWETVLGPTDVLGEIALSKDRVAVSHTDGQVFLLDTKTGKEVAKTEKLGEPVQALAFSPNGKWLVVGCWENVARVYDAETGKQLAILKGHTGVVGAVAFSSDGKMIATGSRDASVKVWEVK